jgi:hypothetical protein
MEELKKRTAVYVQRPREYEISGCPVCGNNDPDWSEYQGHLWCRRCQVDFRPESGGVFDGPVLVKATALLGIDLRMIDLETGEILEL